MTVYIADPRDDNQRDRDGRATTRQVRGLAAAYACNAAADPRLPEAGIDAVVRNRRAAVRGRDRTIRQFTYVETGNTLPTAIVEDSLLVDAATPDDVVAKIVVGVTGAAASGLSGPNGFDELPGLHQYLVDPQSSQAPSPEALVVVARKLRALGYRASVDHITPLRGTVKTKGGAEPSRVDAQFAPQSRGGDPVRSPVKIAVIDTGITKQERKDGWLEGIAGRAERADPIGIDPLDAFPVVNPDGTGGPDGFLDFSAGHGTFVAGIIEQVAPDAQVHARRAVDSDGVGSELDVALAMVRAVRLDGVELINLSLGVETVDAQPLLAIECALDVLDEIAPDVLVVAAAGNNGTNAPCFPAASQRVVAVAALAADGTPAPWSSRGYWVDCSTVGEGILSTYVNGKESPDLDPDGIDEWIGPDQGGEDPWAVWSGTSFAAPQIVGAVARLLGTGKFQTPRQALRALLERGGEPPFDRRLPDFGQPVHILPGTALRTERSPQPEQVVGGC